VVLGAKFGDHEIRIGVSERNTFDLSFNSRAVFVAHEDSIWIELFGYDAWPIIVC
jgi:hypothetical protein